MATFIFNSNNFNFGKNIQTQSSDPVPLYERDLATHIGVCLQQIPPKQLCRCLRESFMLRWEELQLTSANFKDLVTEMTILMARLDAEEDKKEECGDYSESDWQYYCVGDSKWKKRRDH